MTWDLFWRFVELQKFAKINAANVFNFPMALFKILEEYDQLYMLLLNEPLQPHKHSLAFNLNSSIPTLSCSISGCGHRYYSILVSRSRTLFLNGYARLTLYLCSIYDVAIWI